VKLKEVGVTVPKQTLFCPRCKDENGKDVRLWERSARYKQCPLCGEGFSPSPNNDGKWTSVDGKFAKER